VNSYNVWGYTQGNHSYYRSMLVDLTQPPDQVCGSSYFYSFVSYPLEIYTVKQKIKIRSPVLTIFFYYFLFSLPFISNWNLIPPVSSFSTTSTTITTFSLESQMFLRLRWWICCNTMLLYFYKKCYSSKILLRQRMYLMTFRWLRCTLRWLGEFMTNHRQIFRNVDFLANFVRRQSRVSRD